MPWSICPDIYFIPLRGVVQARCARSCSCGNAELKDEEEAGKDTTLRPVSNLLDMRCKQQAPRARSQVREKRQRGTPP